MTDIVDRIRAYVGNERPNLVYYELLRGGADEIERLRADLTNLRANYRNLEDRHRSLESRIGDLQASEAELVARPLRAEIGRLLVENAELHEQLVAEREWRCESP